MCSPEVVLRDRDHGFRMRELKHPDLPNGPAIMSRLAALDLIIKQGRRDLDETLELIERLREQCIDIERRVVDAVREQASLLTQAERL